MKSWLQDEKFAVFTRDMKLSMWRTPNPGVNRVESQSSESSHKEWTRDLTSDFNLEKLPIAVLLASMTLLATSTKKLFFVECSSFEQFNVLIMSSLPL